MTTEADLSVLRELAAAGNSTAADQLIELTFE
jgi:hypothetical protein